MIKVILKKSSLFYLYLFPNPSFKNYESALLFRVLDEGTDYTHILIPSVNSVFQSVTDKILLGQTY